MAAFCRTLQKSQLVLKTVTLNRTSLAWTECIRYKFTRSRLPAEVFEVRPEDHEKYGGDPQQPHKLHLVTRIRSGIKRPYWEKEILQDLGLDKERWLRLGPFKYTLFMEHVLYLHIAQYYNAHQVRVHKNIPAINERLKVIKHLVRVQPLRLPHGLPTEEEMDDTYVNSKGELIIRQCLHPLKNKEIES